MKTAGVKAVGVRTTWALMALLALAACGKRGHPEVPGPPAEVTYPKIYPAP